MYVYTYSLVPIDLCMLTQFSSCVPTGRHSLHVFR